ncbi:ralA-binding protein 1 [Vespula squamosa]|uniref:RalA-binding protein 1 n=1 Tax=Vespula squamosa TaxID=30214 RepID=A0ABD2ABX3_VESSQ
MYPFHADGSSRKFASPLGLFHLGNSHLECTFPPRWEGTWFQSGVRQSIVISRNELSRNPATAASSFTRSTPMFSSTKRVSTICEEKKEEEVEEEEEEEEEEEKKEEDEVEIEVER